MLLKEQMGFPDGSDGTESACNVGDSVSIPRLGRTPGRGNGNPLQYSCLEDSVGREMHPKDTQPDNGMNQRKGDEERTRKTVL